MSIFLTKQWFAMLAEVKATQLHHKGALTKNLKKKKNSHK